MLYDILPIKIAVDLKGIDFSYAIEFDDFWMENYLFFLIIHKSNLMLLRILWFSAVAISIVFSAYLMGDLWYKRTNYPVTVIHDDKIATIGYIPFPAITICPPMRFSVAAFNLSNFLNRFANNWPKSFMNATQEE